MEQGSGGSVEREGHGSVTITLLHRQLLTVFVFSHPVSNDGKGNDGKGNSVKGSRDAEFES